MHCNEWNIAKMNSCAYFSVTGKCSWNLVTNLSLLCTILQWVNRWTGKRGIGTTTWWDSSAATSLTPGGKQVSHLNSENGKNGSRHGIFFLVLLGVVLRKIGINENDGVKETAISRRSLPFPSPTSSLWNYCYCIIQQARWGDKVDSWSFKPIKAESSSVMVESWSIKPIKAELSIVMVNR